MLSWTSWRRKQLFLSYIQLVRSRADVRGRGLQRAVVLTLSSGGNELHIVVALKQQKSCSVTIKTRNKKKTYIPDTAFLQWLHNLSMCVGSLMHVPDARLPHCTPEQRYLFVASADVYLCQWRIKLPAVWSAYLWIKVHCRCVGSVRIWLNRSCVFWNRRPRLAKSCPTWFWGDWALCLGMLEEVVFFFFKWHSEAINK